MAPLAEAYVRLRSDSSMLSGDVRRDAAKAGTLGGATMGRAMSTEFRRATRALVGLGIGTFAIEAGRSVLHFADDFERSRSRLETITKNIGSDFGSVSGAIASTDKRMEAFGFTNAQTEGSLAGLESATKNVPQSLKLVALAADIARGRNISLDESTALLMRAETGHVASLGRLGIATKDAAGHTLTLGQELDLLAQRYGGAASNFAKTYAGRQEAVTASIHDSAAAIGVALLPAAADLAKVLQDDVLPPLQHTAEFFDRNRKTIEPLVGTVLKLVLAYKGLKIAQAGLEAFGIGKASAGVADRGVLGIAREGYSVAKPLPVYVVNGMPGAGGSPVVGSAEKDVAAETEGRAAGRGFMSKVLDSGAVRFLGTAVGLDITARIFKSATAEGNRNFTRNDFGTLVDRGSVTPQNPHGVPMASGKFGAAGIPHGVTLPGAGGSSGSGLGTGFLVGVTRKLTGAERELAGALSSVNPKLLAQAVDLDKVQARALALSQGQDDLRQAVHNMAVTVAQQSSHALKGNSDAALANRDALRGAVSQAENYLTTLKQHGASAHHVADVEVTLSKAIKHNADETYGNKAAVHALLKQLDFLPGQLQTVATAFDLATGAQDVFSTHAEQLAQRGIFGPVAKKNAKDGGSDLGKSVSGGYDSELNKGVADASKKAADAAKAAFDKARSQMQSDLSSFKSFFSQQRQTILSTFSAFDTTPGSDLLGAGGPPKPFLGQLRAEAKEADTFTRLWIRLDNENLDPRLLDLFAGLGPAAIPTMQLWASHPRKIRRADRLEHRISRDATRIGSRATEDKYGPQIHQDLRDLPARLLPVLERGLRHMHINVNLNDVDRREGHKVQVS